MRKSRNNSIVLLGRTNTHQKVFQKAVTYQFNIATYSVEPLVAMIVKLTTTTITTEDCHLVSTVGIIGSAF